MSYYNTVRKDGEQLKMALDKTETQEDLVLLLFRNNPYKNYTPFEVLKELGIKAPITSIRRAITDLTQDGKLRKLDIRRVGEYGEPNYTWMLIR